MDVDELEPTAHRYPHVLRAVFGEPWAIEESALLMIAEIAQLRAGGFRFTAEAIAARIEAARPMPRQRRTGGAVAVIPVHGPIVQRAGSLDAMSGATSTEAVAHAFREAMADDEIKAVLFDIDSPGGSVFGIEELAAEIYRARGRKPMTAVANSLAASAAYWIATAADRVVVTPSGQVGSIGIVSVHMDESAHMEAEGLRPTVLTTAPYKAEGNRYEPLGDEARTEAIGRMGAYHEMFVDAIARGRSVTAAKVESDFGQGRVVMAQDAVKRGMADRVATFDQALAELAGSGGAREMTVAAAAGSDETAAVDAAEVRARAERQASLIRMGFYRGGTARTAGANSQEDESNG